MSDEAKPPVLWSTVITRWAVVVLLAVVVFIGLRPTAVTWFAAKKKHHITGDPADIRLVAVAPDGEDVLIDPRGKMLPGEKLQWPGERTYTWSPQQMQRDFLFELGPGTEGLDFLRDNAGSVSPSERRGWLNASSVVLGQERLPVAGGRNRILLRANFSQTAWHSRNIFRPGQAPIEEVDVSLQFFPPERTRAQGTFNGPFVPGVTNLSRKSSPVHLIVLTNAPQLTARGAAFRAWAQGWIGPYDRLLVYDTDGKRHFPENHNSGSAPLGWTNEFVVPGVPLARVATVTFGEQPRVKTFHNIVVKYPDRPPLPHSPALDRLAAALGKTNLSPNSLEHYSPRDAIEAFATLEHLPNSHNALSALAHSGRTTNFSELSPAQRDTLRARALALARSPDMGRSDLALRIGLRGGWPEFTTLAVERLTNGLPRERLTAAYALTARPKILGPEHIPMLATFARTNDPPGLGANLVRLLSGIRDPAATNALLELARVPEPSLWWSAISSLRAKQFEPLTALSDEMQQRVLLVKDLTNAVVSPELRAAAHARLPALLTAGMQATAPAVFADVQRRIAARLARPAAMEAMMKYLRDGDAEQWKSTQPADIVRQVNAWYGKDFGGLGDGTKSTYNHPSYESWPGIIEDVLEFHDRLKRDGKVETGK